MNITINKGESQIKVQTNPKVVKRLNERYPEVAMMTAMEECSELAIAISKCVRNGNQDKIDNLTEEIIDVLTVIQWAIDRFNISTDALQKWNDAKYERTNERSSNDEIIFRTNDAYMNYMSHYMNPDSSSLTIVKGPNSDYDIVGDIKNAPEYYHVLRSHLVNRDEKILERVHQIRDELQNAYEENDYEFDHEADIKYVKSSDIKYEKSSPEKIDKKASKELSKILNRANKKAKTVDKKKKGKKGKK